MCPPWLGCCVRLAGLVSQFVSQFVSHLALSFAWLGCCVRLAGLVSQFVSQFVSHLALSFNLAGVLCPPRWAFPKQFTVGVLKAVLSVSALPGCCVRLAGLVSQFVSHLALSFTLAGVLCPPRWACLPICLPICLPSGFVLCPPRGACLPICLPPGFVFHLGWGAVLSPPFVSHLALFPKQFTVGVLNAVLSVSALAGMPCPRLWSRLPLVSGFVSQLVSHLGWGAASASLVSAFSCLRFCLPTCLPSWLGCCVRQHRLPNCLKPKKQHSH